MKLIFASHNAHKATEIQQILPSWIEIKTLSDLHYMDEIPENEATIEGNSQFKARFVHEKFEQNCFADDTGLEIFVLNGRPGVHSARYAGEQKNANDNIDLSQGLTLTSNISKDLDFSISTTGIYTIVNSSLQSNLDQNYYIQSSNFRFYYSPNKGKLFISNIVNNSLYRGLSPTLDQSVWLWNIEAGYRFTKDNKAELKFTVFDLLNQNNAIGRTVSDVSIEDTFTRVLTRYGLVTFSYNIGNFKPQAASPEQGRPPFGGGGRTW